MDERVWVGSRERTPAGAVGFDSIEAFLSSTMIAHQILIEDPAATRREADFLKLFSHSPLAQIEREVGPWRAGLARTDPAWPLVTTSLSAHDWSSPLPDEWAGNSLPLTADYEDIAAAAVSLPVCLEGIRFSVQIADGELRQLWEDLLPRAGAELVALPDSAEVWLWDGSPRRELPAAETFCVLLTTAPWQTPASAQQVAFSISASPWSVMGSIAERLRRGDREAD